METIEIDERLQIEIRDGDVPVLWLHNNDDDGIVVVWPGQIGALREALAEAGSVAAAMVSGEHGKAVIV